MNNITQEELLEAFINWNKGLRNNPGTFITIEETFEMDVVGVSTMQANTIINYIKQQRKNEKSSL